MMLTWSTLHEHFGRNVYFHQKLPVPVGSMRGSMRIVLTQIGDFQFLKSQRGSEACSKTFFLYIIFFIPAQLPPPAQKACVLENNFFFLPGWMYCPCLPPPAPRSKCAGQLKGGQLKVPRASNMAHFRGSIVGTMKDGSCSPDAHCSRTKQ